MAVQVHAGRNTLVLTPVGSLDADNRPSLDACVTIALAQRWPLVVVDLGDVSAVTEEGARPLQRLCRTPGRRTVLLSQPSDAVARDLLELGLGNWLVRREPDLPGVAVPHARVRADA